jgi:CBS domain-containing protein
MVTVRANVPQYPREGKMQALDIMTTRVATVSPDTPVADVARLMLDRRVSAVPVVDAGDTVVGIISEDDLIRRLEPPAGHRGSWWMAFLMDSNQRAADFIKAHGQSARDVMTAEVVTVDEDTDVGTIAETLEKKHIKRVPVLRGGKLAGMVSRADLLRAVLALGSVSTPSGDDRSHCERIETAIRKNGLSRAGIAHLWGVVETEDERAALRVAAEEVVGAGKVEDHLGKVNMAMFGE